ncbi:MAG: flavin reductase family protein [Actinomycetota bacterium]|nr:flavin reductase family protein [Actinomycetota bacterium]
MTQTFSGRKAMGAIGSPVFLVTSAHDGERGIMTANMVAGISFKPPLVSVSLSKHSQTGKLAGAGGELALNIIPASLMDLAKKIGRSSGNKIDKFEEFAIETIPGEATSCPLVTGAVTALECKIESATDIGLHSLYIAQVTAYHDLNPGTPLYLFHGRYFALGEELGTFL